MRRAQNSSARSTLDDFSDIFYPCFAPFEDLYFSVCREPKDLTRAAIITLVFELRQFCHKLPRIFQILFSTSSNCFLANLIISFSPFFFILFLPSTKKIHFDLRFFQKPAQLLFQFSTKFSNQKHFREKSEKFRSDSVMEIL